MNKQTMTMPDNKGFTLIEMVIGLALSSMIILACYSFIAAGTKSYESSRSQTRIQQEMQIANNFIEDVIMEADMNNIKYRDDSIASVLYTKDKILYYDKDTNMFCIYEATETPGIDMTDHLITDCMERFEVSFVATSQDDSNISLNPPTTTGAGGAGGGSSSILIFADSDLVQVGTTYKVKQSSLNSEKLYKLRN